MATRRVSSHASPLPADSEDFPEQPLAGNPGPTPGTPAQEPAPDSEQAQPIHPGNNHKIKIRQFHPIKPFSYHMLIIH